MDVSESSGFALVWNMIRSRLPDEILDDFDEFSARTNIKRMDADGLMVDPAGGTFYSIAAGDDTFVFHDAELAPPAGVFGKNYSRLAVFIVAILPYLSPALVRSIMSTIPIGLLLHLQYREAILQRRVGIFTCPNMEFGLLVLQIRWLLGSLQNHMEQASKTFHLQMQFLIFPRKV